MGLNHKLNDVQLLLDDSKNLLTNITNGNSNSAYAIIMNLNSAYNTLVNCWKGMDAGVNINNIVNVYNSLLPFRIKMAELATYSYNEVGIYYRNIQSANGAPVEVPGPISDDVSVASIPGYQDKTDTISITPTATEAKNKLDQAKDYFEELKSSFANTKDSILNNWTEGDRHSEFEQAFQDFNSKFTKYEEILSKVSANITTAISNYGG